MKSISHFHVPSCFSRLSSQRPFWPGLAIHAPSRRCAVLMAMEPGALLHGFRLGSVVEAPEGSDRQFQSVKKVHRKCWMAYPVMFYHIIQAFDFNNSAASHILWILAVNSAPPTYHCFEISTLEMKSCICFVFGVWFVWGRWCSGAKRTDRAASVALLHWDWIKGHERSWGALPVMTCHDTFAPWVRPTTLDSKYMLYMSFCLLMI